MNGSSVRRIPPPFHPPSRQREGGQRGAGEPSSIVLIDSYHCSRYNTNTGRLTEAMFRDVFRQIQEILK